MSKFSVQLFKQIFPKSLSISLSNQFALSRISMSQNWYNQLLIRSPSCNNQIIPEVKTSINFDVNITDQSKKI